MVRDSNPRNRENWKLIGSDSQRFPKSGSDDNRGERYERTRKTYEWVGNGPPPRRRIVDVYSENGSSDPMPWDKEF